MTEGELRYSLCRENCWAFSFGEHQCIGRYLSVLVSTIVTGVLLRSLSFQLSKKKQPVVELRNSLSEDNVAVVPIKRK